MKIPLRIGAGFFYVNIQGPPALSGTASGLRFENVTMCQYANLKMYNLKICNL